MKARRQRELEEQWGAMESNSGGSSVRKGGERSGACNKQLKEYSVTDAREEAASMERRKWTDEERRGQRREQEARASLAALARFLSVFACIARIEIHFTTALRLLSCGSRRCSILACTAARRSRAVLLREL